MNKRIPKIIHYCWFGGKPLPKLAQKCIASWERFCPGYEIKRWDETNFNVRACLYSQQAYEAKKWAFVSDYARFKILYEQGGIYFDTDVELIKPLKDILEKGPFMGFESDAKGGQTLAVAPGLGMGVPPGWPVCRELLEIYQKSHFLDSTGKADMKKVKTVVMYMTEVLNAHGLQNKSGIQQIDGVFIYPKEYFNPKDLVTHQLFITPHTYAIHHFDGSWVSGKEKIKKWFNKQFGRNPVYAKLKAWWKQKTHSL